MSEAILQLTLVSQLRMLYPDVLINLSLNGIPLNGMPIKQKAQLIRECKRNGMHPGMPDLTLYLPNGKVLNLELKNPKGGVQSKEQYTVQIALEALGHNYYIIHDVSTVLNLITFLTSLEFRKSQYEQLDMPTTATLQQPFMHWAKGTPIIKIINTLKSMYNI